MAKKAVDSELNLFNNAPLLWSIEVGRTEVIRILVDSGMIFDDTALHLAMDQGSSGLEPLSILLGSGGTADAIHAGQTLLDRAIGSQPDFIPTLLEHGATPTLESLELAIEHQRDTLIVDFLDRGVTVSPRSLSLAVQRGDRAEILVADLLHHIDPNETALGDDPVLLLAIKSRQEDLVGLLVASGAIVDPDYLLVAVSQGDAAAEILRTLLYGLPENDRPPTDNLLVYRAIRNRSDNVLDILLEHGSPIGTQSFDEALNQDDVALVSRLLDAGAAPSPNSLATSIRRPNAEMLKVLLEFGASIRPTDLSLAIDRGNQPAIDLLLSHGAAIGAQDVRTAIEMKDHGLIKTLIDHGAPITHGTLKFAIETQDTNVIVALLEAGADVSSPPSDETQSLLDIALRASAEVAALLLKHGAPPTSDSFVLAYRLGQGNEELLRQLLERGANPNVEVSGQNMLYRAAANGESSVVRLLLEFGADPNGKHGQRDWTPLHGIAFSDSSNASVIQALLDAGGDLQAVSTDGDSPCDVARRYSKRDDIVAFLCQ